MCSSPLTLFDCEQRYSRIVFQQQAFAGFREKAAIPIQAKNREACLADLLDIQVVCEGRVFLDEAEAGIGLGSHQVVDGFLG